VLGYERIPGSPLLGRSPPAGAARRLGRFLRELHAIDPTTVADLVPTEDVDPGAWLAELDGPGDLVRVLHATRPQPSPHRVVAHADLGAEHILELDGTLTGIIDWSDAAITDPALDLARLYRDFGPGFLSEVSQVYGPLAEAMPRIEFFARCATLEDLAYGRATSRREYVTNSERSFAWLFPWLRGPLLGGDRLDRVAQRLHPRDGVRSSLTLSIIRGQFRQDRSRRPSQTVMIFFPRPCPSSASLRAFGASLRG
jgi:Phosphotransferase enzyme family